MRTPILAAAAVAMIFAACAGPQEASPDGTLTRNPETAGASSNTASAPTIVPLSGFQTATGQPLPTPDPALAWDISQLRIQGDGVFSLGLSLDSRGLWVSGAQFTLHYPPGSVQILEVVPGSLLGPDPLLVAKSGTEPGRYIGALARRGQTEAPTPASTLAEILIKANLDPDRSGGETGGGPDAAIWLTQVKVVDGSFQVIDNPAIMGTISSSD